MSEETEVRQWGPWKRFTPTEYEEYEALPLWALDSPDFQDKNDYHDHWETTVLQWVSQAKKHQGRWKETCMAAMKDVEDFEQDKRATGVSIERSLAFQVLDLAYAYVQEGTALLSINPPQGTLVATQESENSYVAALNTLMAAEFKSNDVEQLVFDSVYEGQFFNIAWWKTSVDYNQFGHMGQKGKICIEPVDTEDMHFDPKAKRLSWDYMNYVIQESKHEIGEIRQAYPITGAQISVESESSSFSSMMDERSEDHIKSPLGNLTAGPSGKRQELKTYEAWFKDSRLQFIPDREDRMTEVWDEDKEEFVGKLEVGALKLDDEGFVLGDWVPMYPKGRCIVLCEGVVLEDMANRMPHGRCPFIPVQLAPNKSLTVPGNATRIMVVARKINDILGRSHAYAQSEIERPMHAEFGTFANAQYYKKVPNVSNKVVMLSQGKSGTFVRPMPVELPMFTWEMLKKYEQYLDMLSGSSAVMRGTISDGAQISAEALASLQTFASSRLALSAKFLARAVKELTYQVVWLIRAIYDENIQIKVTLPDGRSEEINWASDKAIFNTGDEEQIAKITSKQSYLVDIKAGTGSPNAAQARQSTADHLYDRKAIDRIAYLDAYEFPDRQNIDKRMEADEKSDLAAEAMGRKLGLHVLEIEKKHDAGRKPKY